MEEILTALAIINHRANMIAEEVGKIDPDYEKIERYVESIKKSADYIHTKTQQNEQTTTFGQRKPNNTGSSNTTTTNETI